LVRLPHPSLESLLKMEWSRRQDKPCACDAYPPAFLLGRVQRCVYGPAHHESEDREEGSERIVG
jgi:hypothetical protein